MAQKRMFDKTIIDSDDFLDLPLTSQALYFHLNMRADDDGFVDNWKAISRIVGAKDDDIKILIAKSFIIPFESGVIVIKHWKINNYLQKDRKKNTRYLQELQSLKEINGEYYLLEDGEITNILMLNDEEKEKPEWQKMRDDAYKNSSLPYSFLYKIRNAFNDVECPICHNIMRTSGIKKYIPSIQHLIPISKGGKHELDNIAIICLSCNTKIKDNIIEEKLNNKEVIKKWEEIQNDDKFYTRSTSGNIDKNSIDKNSIDKNSIDKNSIDKNIIYTSKQNAYDDEFEMIWSKYPKKRGKENAKRDFIKARKEGISYEEIENGLNNYSKFIEITKRKHEFVLNGSTWFHQRRWNDEYTNEDIGISNIIKNSDEFKDMLKKGLID